MNEARPHQPLTRHFPAPPALVRNQLELLQRADAGDSQALQQINPVWEAERPWDPPTCRPSTRAQLWVWLDEVAGWLNHEYGRQIDHQILSCWPRHPNTVRELALIACLRWAASFDYSPTGLNTWQEVHLPGFYQRAVDPASGTGCLPGTHRPCPGAVRSSDYASQERRVGRSALFKDDLARSGEARACQ